VLFSLYHVDKLTKLTVSKNNRNKEGNDSCLPFTLKNRLNHRMEITTGMRSFHFHDFSRKIGNYRASLELVKLANGTHIFHSGIPLENIGLSFKRSRFPDKISFRGDKINLSIYIPSEISGFSGQMVNNRHQYPH